MCQISLKKKNFGKVATLNFIQKIKILETRQIFYVDDWLGKDIVPKNTPNESKTTGGTLPGISINEKKSYSCQ